MPACRSQPCTARPPAARPPCPPCVVTVCAALPPRPTSHVSVPPPPPLPSTGARLPAVRGPAAVRNLQPAPHQRRPGAAARHPAGEPAGRPAGSQQRGWWVGGQALPALPRPALHALPAPPCSVSPLYCLLLCPPNLHRASLISSTGSCWREWCGTRLPSTGLPAAAPAAAATAAAAGHLITPLRRYDGGTCSSRRCMCRLTTPAQPDAAYMSIRFLVSFERCDSCRHLCCVLHPQSCSCPTCAPHPSVTPNTLLLLLVLCGPCHCGTAFLPVQRPLFFTSRNMSAAAINLTPRVQVPQTVVNVHTAESGCTSACRLCCSTYAARRCHGARLGRRHRTSPARSRGTSVELCLGGGASEARLLRQRGG